MKERMPGVLASRFADQPRKETHRFSRWCRVFMMSYVLRVKKSVWWPEREGEGMADGGCQQEGCRSEPEAASASRPVTGSRPKHADIRLFLLPPRTFILHDVRRPPAMKLTPELIQAVPSTLNPIKERQLDLRGESRLYSLQSS